MIFIQMDEEMTNPGADQAAEGGGDAAPAGDDAMGGGDAAPAEGSDEAAA